jgi:hypothetical protein
MNGTTVTLQLPAGLYTELQALAQEEHTEPVAFLTELITTARERRACVNDLAALRKQIAQDGGLKIGNTKEEVVERLRQTRREIFEADVPTSARA